MSKIPAFFVVVLCASVLAHGQDKKRKYDPDGVFWASSWKEAVFEAGMRNVPIHFTGHKDG